MVPVTNGAIPVAPEGAHSSQFGTLFELARATVPAASDPLEAGEAVEADVPDPVPEPPPEELLAVELLCPAAAVDSVVAA